MQFLSKEKAHGKKGDESPIKFVGDPDDNEDTDYANSFVAIDINSASKETLISSLQLLLNCIMPSLDHNIVNTHVEFCRVSIVFLAFAYAYRSHYDTSVQLAADDYRKRMKMENTVKHVGWKDSIHDFVSSLTFDRFGKNSPGNLDKLLKITTVSSKWSSIVTEKSKLPVWRTELEYKSYTSARKGLYERHKEFLTSIGFKL